MSHISHGLVPRRGSGRLLPLAIGVASALLLVGALAWQLFWRGGVAPNGRLLLAKARVALANEEFDLAERLVQQIDRQDPLWSGGRLVAGEAATRAGRFDQALRHYQSIPRDGSTSDVLAVFSSAELHRDAGRLSSALQDYLYCLQSQPNDVATHERLAFLYNLTGRRWESFPHFFFLVLRGKLAVDSLALLGDLERPVEQPEYIERCVKNAPDDILVVMAQGAQAFVAGNSSQARPFLQQVVDRDRSLVAAQAMLGELLIDSDTETFNAWHSRLPAVADSYADTWYVRGLRARRHGKLRVAARCFWEAIRLAPTHRRATYQLGQVLIALGESSGQEFSKRSSLLFELTHTLDNALKSQGRDEVTIRKIVELMLASGRLWEAWAWAKLAAQTFPDADWATAEISRLETELSDQTPATLDSANLALKFPYGDWPDHREIFAGQDLQPDSAPGPSGQAKIAFEETADAGIDFLYVNGSDPLREEIPLTETTGATQGKSRIRIQTRTRMFEQTGGGVAVLDFDGDRRPDLYFTQGAPWKFGAREPSLADAPSDRLFRNVQGSTFVDVTRQLRLSDRGFGQGCTVGDFDNDGFPDLYVANVGRNRLHRNNGDGTFSDVTEASGIDADDWTASCVLVDLNADGLPDLFDVTYLTGPNIYEAVCNGHACSPKVFDGIPDRLRLNRGDGTFELVADATPVVNSKGLGVVALDLHERNRPCLYIANDQVPSHLLRNHAAQESPHNVRLEEEGFARGLAFNEDGLAMASMGIAADDANGDGRIDFFVTNFKDEADILYLQDTPGLFVDATNPAGLRAAGLPFVGWGTQFLDADRNGDMDLVVTNGHVDDYRGEGGEYHMRPQFFQNVGGGRFVERFAADVGAFFDHKKLGRGLARLDWNGDGRMDFVVSNIGDRASLVTNHSTNIGHFVNVRLHATATARDAIGTTVDVVCGPRRWSKQLVAGDGYMASNERLLQFGLGTANKVSELKVNWPSGNTTVLKDVPSDVTIELVEGSRWGTRWRGSVPESLIIEQPQPASP